MSLAPLPKHTHTASRLPRAVDDRLDQAAKLRRHLARRLRRTARTAEKHVRLRDSTGACCGISKAKGQSGAKWHASVPRGSAAATRTASNRAGWSSSGCACSRSSKRLRRTRQRRANRMSTSCFAINTLPCAWIAAEQPVRVDCACTRVGRFARLRTAVRTAPMFSACARRAKSEQVRSQEDAPCSIRIHEHTARRP
eukprot:6173048-Pleurochrysis_carterae.AAC.2